MAVLRTTIGLTQDELGCLVRRSARTIQAVELGKLPLSDDLALRIAQETGVDPVWLMEGDLSGPPRKGTMALWAGLKPGEYNREFYEFYRAFVESPACPAEEIHVRLVEEAMRLRAGGIKGAAASLLKQALEKGDAPSIRLAKGLLSGPQEKLFAQTDKSIEHMLKQILQLSGGTERANIVRWKLRRFLQQMATENSLELKPLPADSPPVPARPVKRSSGWFHYAPPPGWRASYTADRDTYQHVNGAVLVVTTYGVKQHDGSRDAEQAQNEELLAALREGMQLRQRRASKGPAPEMRASGVQAWSTESESLDGKLSMQTLFKKGRGLLLASYDAPNTPEARVDYDRFVRSVEGNEEPMPEPAFSGRALSLDG